MSAEPASPHQRCPHCGHKMDLHARLCTTCNLWIALPPEVARERRWDRWRTIVSSMVVPATIALASLVYQSSAAKQTRLLNANQHERQLMTDLSSALAHTVELNTQFRQALYEMESACPLRASDAPPAPDAGPPTESCRARYVAGLRKLDDVVEAVAWVLPTVPVESDTYARMQRLNRRYFAAGQDVDGEPRGYRARFMRRLESGEPGATQLKFCHQTRPDDLRGLEVCRREMQRWYEVRFSVMADMRGLICALTRDGNALRRDAWRQMQREGTGLHGERFAQQLEANERESSCAREVLSAPADAEGDEGPSRPGPGSGEGGGSRGGGGAGGHN